MQNTIVGLGEILWDILPSGKTLGGAPANFAYHAQELGGCSVVVSCVGNDELGRQIISSLENMDMTSKYLCDVCHIRDKDIQTITTNKDPLFFLSVKNL